MIPKNCKTGSAWHEWQTSGQAWKCLHPDATKEETEQAALGFANLGGWPANGISARFRAFMEGAT